MLLINKGENNDLVLTLKEKATLTEPFYLFVFTSDMDNTSKIFTAPDISLFPSRYNKFVLTENSVENLASGVVELSPTGFWSYIVYEQVSSTNLLVANTTGIVEEGRINVVGDVEQFATFQKDRQYVTYEKT